MLLAGESAAGEYRTDDQRELELKALTPGQWRIENVPAKKPLEKTLRFVRTTADVATSESYQDRAWDGILNIIPCRVKSGDTFHTIAKARDMDVNDLSSRLPAA